ncbi:hypothetical protein FRZ06_02620 [Anoxybacterium hadale]|uniref:Uncharacterized protein n=1 Tax=Anoxybacterium hadale TaxID=3408580 RepID=A0ACD1A7J6_9FIRM|nr:hypothetical protein FRZ06_02620 [Clostridiales bacterium]
MKRSLRVLSSIILVFALCLSSIVFSSTFAEEKTKTKPNYEQAAGELYYLFWCEGEENVDKARIEFQEAFQLSDADIIDLKQLAADYYFANSDLWYSMQNDMSANTDISKSMSFKENSTKLMDNYIGSISRKLGDSDEFTKWMAKFIADDSAIQAKKNKEFSEQSLARAGTRACRVYATQFNANSANCVALPDKYLKFANLGQISDIPTKYRSTYSGNDYKINISTELSPQTSAYGIKVLEAGPWSIDDNYWDSAGSLPSSRRMYTDLALGKPMAQAAYETGYNGGVNYLGRTITNRAGVDFSRDLATSLGYSSNGSGWVGISTDRLP